METRAVPPPQASARQTEMGEKFNRVLFSTLDALQAHNIPYALIGGIAVSGMGRPRSTHDIDIFVRPDDAEAALEALSKNGFETERTDLRWLFKGWKEEMMVDIIFKSQGDIYFDSEMNQHAKLINYHGHNIPAVSPEDLIIIKAAVHSEAGPHHWHDALAILSHAVLDWKYLLQRSRRAPRRLLALLIYAQSNDIWIPNNIIADLFNVIFEQAANKTAQGSEISKNVFPRIAKFSNSGPIHKSGTFPRNNSGENPINQNSPDDAYLLGHVMERLATDARTAAADLQLQIQNRKIRVKGEATSKAHRTAIEEVIRDVIVDFEIDNQISVAEITAPDREEVV